MKPRKLALIITLTLTTALAVTVHVAAQDSRDHDHKNNHYRLIDLGTLGGPNSYLPLLPPYHDFLPSASLSRSGTFAGSADTTTADPYSPFCFNADCFTSHAVAWMDGTLTDLGALPGPAGSSSAATWISDSGLIAGVSENGDIDPLTGAPAYLGVLWRRGKMINLGTIEGGYESQAMAVNNSGQVVGIASNLVSDANSLWGTTTQARAFLWEDGVMQDLGTLPGGTDAMGLFINERGQIVGQSYIADSIVPPPVGCSDSPLTLDSFFWEKGQMTDLGTLGGHCTFPYSLNNQGQVVGQSNLSGDTTSHPFLWQRGRMKDLGTLGGTYGFAEWLNDAGTVVGSATNQGDQALLGFLWENDKITNSGALPGDSCSAADAINSAGQVVGGSGFYAAPNWPACTDPVEHAVLWENGQILDLNSFVPPGTDLTLNEAFFINDRGEISGVGTLSNGDQHTFLLIPCDKNHQDVDACDDRLVDADAATRKSPAPVMQEPTTAPRAPRRFGRSRLPFRPEQSGAN
jgi:probable HAF family extracellular repeat protein